MIFASQRLQKTETLPLLLVRQQALASNGLLFIYYFAWLHSIDRQDS